MSTRLMSLEENLHFPGCEEPFVTTLNDSCPMWTMSKLGGIKSIQPMKERDYLSVITNNN